MPAKTSTQLLAVAAPVSALRVNVVEAGRIIGLCRAEVYKRVRLGLLTPVKEGSRTLFTVAELTRYCASTDPAAPPPPSAG